MGKFYEYSQNNPGGSFDVDNYLCHRVFIEAPTAEQANAQAHELGIYFNGVEEGFDCECCGDRWYSPDELNVPESVPDIEVYAQELADRWGWTKPDARIFYSNGAVTEIFSKEVAK